MAERYNMPIFRIDSSYLIFDRTDLKFLVYLYFLISYFIIRRNYFIQL